MNITIKKGTTEDLQIVQELNLKLFEKEYEEYDSSLNLDWTFGKPGSKYLSDRLSKDNNCVFIAIVDDKAVGYISGGIEKVEDYRILPIVAELGTIYILDEFRSMEIGKQLYNKFVEWCKMKGVGRVKVEASAQNDKAIKFYRNNGFKDYSLILEGDL